MTPDEKKGPGTRAYILSTERPRLLVRRCLQRREHDRRCFLRIPLDLSDAYHVEAGCFTERFHSGYRVYSTAALRKIPFTLNTNDFHLDTETLKLRPGVNLLASTANVGFFISRLMLLTGQLNCGRRGVLDMTYARLFTFRSFERLHEQAGLRVLDG